ncbi:MAG: hypothetical protein HEQ40_07740 [Lacibacter sp.]|jgi:hypothetical protein
MKKYLIAFISFSVIIVTSCKKKDNPAAPAPAPQKTRLVKADFTSVAGVFAYTYNSNGHIASENFTATTTGNFSRTVTYSNYDLQGRVTEYTVDINDPAFVDSKTVISYSSNGRPERFIYFDLPSGANAGFTTFEYSGLKVIVKRYSSTNTLQGTTEYTYTTDGNNLAEMKVFNAAGVLISTTAYSNYDTKNTYESLLPAGSLSAPLSKNNFQALSRTVHSTGAVTNFTVTFEYNADGYPTKRTLSSGAVSTYEYTKQ